MLNKRVLHTVIFLLVAFAGISQTICSYSYRKRISFDPTKVSGPIDLTNFPVLINITSDNDLRTTTNSGHVTNSSGFDIVFTAADGVTLLNFQLEKYTATNGQLTAWVKIPSLSTSINTYIYMYYGNSSISTDQSSTSVWTNYHGVWHLENGSMTDNSGSGYTLTNNSTTNQSPAYINDGRADNGTQWLEVASTFPNLTTDFSMSAWVYTTDNTRAGQRIFCDDVSNSGGYALSIGDNGTGSIRFFSRSSNPISLDSPNNTIANNTWYYITAVANITGSVKTIYVNGVSVANGSFSNSWGTDAGNSSAAGETASGETGNRLSGRIDEVRVAKSALSADWFLTEYNNQSSPSTFYSISAEPNVFGGGSNSNWNAAANWSSGSAPSASTDVIIAAGSNQPNLNTSIQLNGLWIKTSNTLSINNNQNLSILYDIVNCGVLTGSGANSLVQLNSTSAAIATQYLSGAGTYNLRDLTINNTHTSSPSVVLNSPVSITDDLTLTSGVVSTSTTNILALGTGATSTSGSATSYVSGPMSKDGNTAFVFPVGKGGRWRRLGISAPSASSTFRAEYLNTAYTNTSSVNSPITDVSKIEYWQLDRTVGSGNASLSLYWESAGGSGIDNCADLTIVRFNGTGWDERAATTSTSSTCSGSGAGVVTTTAVVTAFSPFTFGSKSTGVNPLPVELIEFNATCESGATVFKWKTASEFRNDYFSIEYSESGNDWTEVAQVKSKGNSSTYKDYKWEMDGASNGYYRLAQVDIDKSKEVFKIIDLNCFNILNDVYRLFPNPAQNEFNLEFDLTKAYEDVSVVIFDQFGRNVWQKKLNLTKGHSSLNINSQLPQGIYVVRISSDVLNLPPGKLIIE